MSPGHGTSAGSYWANQIRADLERRKPNLCKHHVDLTRGVCNHCPEPVEAPEPTEPTEENPA